MRRELEHCGLTTQQQVRFPVYYEEHLVGQHVLDLVVDSKVYVELKAKELTGLETAQVLSGLKAGQLPVGLLINFNAEHLRDGIKRIILPKRHLLENE